MPTDPGASHPLTDVSSLDPKGVAFVSLGQRPRNGANPHLPKALKGRNEDVGTTFVALLQSFIPAEAPIPSPLGWADESQPFGLKIAHTSCAGSTSSP